LAVVTANLKESTTLPNYSRAASVNVGLLEHPNFYNLNINVRIVVMVNEVMKNARDMLSTYLDMDVLVNIQTSNFHEKTRAQTTKTN